METVKIKDEDHYKCRAVKAERDQLKAENDRLRAELAERDKAVLVGEVREVWRDAVNASVRWTGIRDVQAGDKLYTHPPRQAVPDWVKRHIRAIADCATIRDKSAKTNPALTVDGSAVAGIERRARELLDRISEHEQYAAPEARSEVETCKMCGGSGVNQLSPDPAVIGTATCSHCGGRGKHKPLLPVRTEAEIQAEALADLVPTTWLDPLLTGEDSILGNGHAFDCNDVERLLRAIKRRIQNAEAARLREGEK